MRHPNGLARLFVVGLVALVAGGARAGEPGRLDGFLGTWRGTSTCTNRKVAPGCNDETVVYEVRASDKPKTAILKADKIVNGERRSMGDLEFAYSDKDGCWRSEINMPSVHGVWCLVVEGRNMTGSLRVIPENVDVRKVQAVHD
jgi:hypothetical protein